MRQFRIAFAMVCALSAGPAVAMILGSDEFERPPPQEVRTRTELLGSLASAVVHVSKLTVEDLRSVNTAVNRTPYVADADNYGVDDYWASPDEFAARGGDCEDYAIAKYALLKARGLSANQMRIVIVRDLELNTAHAVLSVNLGGVHYILDNQSSDVRRDTDVTRYRPVYSLNEAGWWLHMPHG